MIEVVYDLLFPSYMRGSHYSYLIIAGFVLIALVNFCLFIIKKEGKFFFLVFISFLVFVIYNGINNYLYDVPTEHRIFPSNENWEYSKFDGYYHYKYKKSENVMIRYAYVKDDKGISPNQNDVSSCEKNAKCINFKRNTEAMYKANFKGVLTLNNNIKCLFFDANTVFLLSCPNGKKGIYHFVSSPKDNVDAIALSEMYKLVYPKKWK